MPSAVTSIPRAGSDQPDDLDKLLDYDNAVEEFLRDIPADNEGRNTATTAAQPSRDDDQEVQVKKKRKLVPKLDENLLLSDAGIVKLRKITKSRLKFKGKGHEFSDISRLLNTYQLWLDDLYPRARFRDGLTMVEKVGHSKRLQVMRRAWLDDTKPYRREPSPELDLPTANNGDADCENFGQQQQQQPNVVLSNNAEGIPQEDELDALFAENEPRSTTQAQKPQQSRRGPFEEDESDEDELDALQAEEHSSRPANKAQGTEHSPPNDDELDALMAEAETSTQSSRLDPISCNGNQYTHEKDHMDDFADDEEAMAGMAGMW